MGDKQQKTQDETQDKTPDQTSDGVHIEVQAEAHDEAQAVQFLAMYDRIRATAEAQVAAYPPAPVLAQRWKEHVAQLEAQGDTQSEAQALDEAQITFDMPMDLVDCARRLERTARARAQVEAQGDAQSEAQVEAQADVQAEAQAEAQGDAQSEAQVEAQADVQADVQAGREDPAAA